MTSKEGTPPFSGTMIKSLIRHNRYKENDNQCEWSKDAKQHYWELSDFVHVKGMEKGFRKLNLGSISGSPGNRVLPINTETLDSTLGIYISTVQHIAVALCLYNPILLLGMPIDEKFGINGPMGGFYNEGQAESIKALIPEKFMQYFDDLIVHDEGIQSISSWFRSQPDALY